MALNVEKNDSQTKEDILLAFYVCFFLESLYRFNLIEMFCKILQKVTAGIPLI